MTKKFMGPIMGLIISGLFSISYSFAMDGSLDDLRVRHKTNTHRSQLVESLYRDIEEAQAYCSRKARELKKQGENEHDSEKLTVSRLFDVIASSLACCPVKQFNALKVTGFESLLRDIKPYLSKYSPLPQSPLRAEVVENPRHSVLFSKEDIEKFDFSFLKEAEVSLRKSMEEDQKSLSNASGTADQQDSIARAHLKVYCASKERLITLIQEMLPLVARKHIEHLFAYVDILNADSNPIEVSSNVRSYAREIIQWGQTLRSLSRKDRPQKDLIAAVGFIKEYFKEVCPHEISVTVKTQRRVCGKNDFLGYVDLFFTMSQEENPHFYALLEAISTFSLEIYDREKDSEISRGKLNAAFREIYLAVLRSYVAADGGIFERGNWTIVAYIKMLHKEFSSR